MRGDVLPLWEPAGPLGPEERRRWTIAAERIAAGIAELAHLDAFVDVLNLRVGFSCDGDTDLAAAYERAIREENVAARQVAPAVAGRDDRPADEVVLPCRPDASDEEITHVVLATLKASHALEFIPVAADEPGDGAAA